MHHEPCQETNRSSSPPNRRRGHGLPRQRSSAVRRLRARPARRAARCRVTLSALRRADGRTATVHKLVEICDASGHVANEYCAQVPGNATHNVGAARRFPRLPENGVVVLDQAYADA
ncbi:MAG: hypothetical protein ACLU3I_15865 [Acutalibacteraceae bacterium]